MREKPNGDRPRSLDIASSSRPLRGHPSAVTITSGHFGRRGCGRFVVGARSPPVGELVGFGSLQVAIRKFRLRARGIGKDAGFPRTVAAVRITG